MRRLVLLAALSLIACSTPQQSHPFDSVARTIADRTHQKIRYDFERPAELDTAIADLLSRPLTLDSTIQIALLNNRTLAAQYEDIAIAQSQFITSSQVKNPTFFVDARLPDKPPRGTDIEASLMVDVVDIFMIPIRKKLTSNQLDQATLQASDITLQFVHDVKAAFYRYITQRQLVELQQKMTDASSAAEDFAEHQYAAGNINDLDLLNRQTDAAQSRLDLIQAQSELTAARESLNMLLSLTPSQTNWSAETQLPALPPTESSPSQHRLDLDVAARQVALAEQALRYTTSGILTEINLGVSSERQTSSQTIVGPAVSLEVPIFNQHQGQISRAQAELRQAKKNLDALTFKAESEIRLATARVNSARQAAQLATDTLLPRRIKALAYTQKQYNGMLIGQYALLAAKQEELIARKKSVEFQRDYWLARADLDRATGN